MPLEDAAMRLALEFAPVQLGAIEGLARLRIGNVVRIPSEGGELALAALAHGTSQFEILVSGKVEERRRCAPFLAMKEHRHERRSEDQRGGDLQTAGAHQMRAALALRPVADLVMSLRIAEEVMPRQAR